MNMFHNLLGYYFVYEVIVIWAFKNSKKNYQLANTESWHFTTLTNALSKINDRNLPGLHISLRLILFLSREKMVSKMHRLYMHVCLNFFFTVSDQPMTLPPSGHNIRNSRNEDMVIAGLLLFMLAFCVKS